jgi:hypothetical protein
VEIRALLDDTFFFQMAIFSFARDFTSSVADALSTLDLHVLIPDYFQLLIILVLKSEHSWTTAPQVIIIHVQQIKGKIKTINHACKRGGKTQSSLVACSNRLVSGSAQFGSFEILYQTELRIYIGSITTQLKMSRKLLASHNELKFNYIYILQRLVKRQLPGPFVRWVSLYVLSRKTRT